MVVVFVNVSIGLFRSAQPPRRVAFEFMEALYNKKDLELAKHYATGDMKNALMQFDTAEDATQFLFNMKYDSILITGEEIDDRVNFTDRGGRIRIFFIGKTDRQNTKTSNIIRLVEVDDCWYVVRGGNFM